MSAPDDYAGYGEMLETLTRERDAAEAAVQQMRQALAAVMLAAAQHDGVSVAAFDGARRAPAGRVVGGHRSDDAPRS